MPEIEENQNSSKKTVTEYEISPEKSKDDPEIAKPDEFSESPIFSNQKINQLKNGPRSSSSKKMHKSGSSHKNHLKNSLSAQNLVESHNADYGIYAKKEQEAPNPEVLQDYCSDLITQLNLGSPRNHTRAPKPARNVVKRPNSAGNRMNKDHDPDELSSNLLASTIGISRNKVKVNLANMLFSQPEVESMVNPMDSRSKFSLKGSRVPSANNIRKNTTPSESKDIPEDKQNEANSKETNYPKPPQETTKTPMDWEKSLVTLKKSLSERKFKRQQE